MKIMSWNVNGVRAVARKGFEQWFAAESADVVCLQEIKAREDQLEEELRHPQGYYSYWHPAQKAGYSGTAIFSRKEPKDVIYGIGDEEFDCEGRVLQADYGDYRVISAYFPNSQRDHARLGYKLAFCDTMLKYLESLRAEGKNVILCGDYNIAHKEIDLRNPKTNRNNAGFLPEERAWMDEFLKLGYVDTFRKFEEGPDHYTWWSYRPGVRAKNVGWRIDYTCVNPEFEERVKSSFHQPEVMGSDHCPIGIELRS